MQLLSNYKQNNIIKNQTSRFSELSQVSLIIIYFLTSILAPLSK